MYSELLREFHYYRSRYIICYMFVTFIFRSHSFIFIFRNICCTPLSPLLTRMEMYLVPGRYLCYGIIKVHHFFSGAPHLSSIYHQSSIVINHHQPSSTIISHQSSSIIINHHQSITNHHQSIINLRQSSIINNHQNTLLLVN